MSDYESKLVDSSRLLIDILTAEIGNDENKFKEMYTVALLDKYPYSMRAARVLQYSTEKYPLLVLPYLSDISKKLNELRVDGVKRSFLKMILAAPTLPDENSLGLLTDYCFSAFHDTNQAIAIRAYSIDVLLILVEKYPELIDEFYAMLETRKSEESAGMRRKIKHTLAILNKLRNQCRA